MEASLCIVRYPRRYAFFGLLAMAIYRLPLSFNTHIQFHKLMGCGKDGAFNKTPDLRQWAIFAVHDRPGVYTGLDGNISKRLYGSFISWWLQFFKCETWTVLLQPIEGHGLWDGKKIFGELSSKSDHVGTIAILTRASIRLTKLRDVWKNVPAVADALRAAPGLVTSIGFGELPWLRQATFSVWENKASMTSFAYKMHEHADVINKTRERKWYSEELFVRFRVAAAYGTLHGKEPLAGKL